MTVPSSNDITRLRGHRHSTSVIINAVPLIPLATARVNQAAFTYPIGELTVDNTSADWLTKVKVGHLVAIGTTSGGHDITWGVVRKAPMSTKLYIDGKSRGDPGYARNILKELANDAYITVYKFRPAWGLLSSIRQGKFYKNFDLAYTNQGAKPDPLIRMGRWLQGFIDADTETASFELTAEGVAWGTATIASYSWYVDGLTVTAGDTDEASLTLEGEAGFYEVTCTVTDSSGKSRTGYRYIWINDPDPTSAYAPFSYRHACRIVSDDQDVIGRSVRFEVDGNFAADELFPGQAFMLTETPRYNGQALDNPDLVAHTYIGYAADKSLESSYKTRTLAITTRGPLALASEITTVTQQMVEKSAPKNWTECTKVLSNPVGAVWYVAAHHAPYLIDGHDFQFTAEFLSLRRKSFVFQSSDISGQIHDVAEMILGAIGCRGDGTLRMVRNPMYASNTARNAMDTKWTWQPGDIEGAVEYPFSYRMAVGQVLGYAFSYNGGAEPKAYASAAPGSVKSQAGDVQSMTPFIVTTSGGQSHVNTLTGHHFALVNNPTPTFTIRADRNLDICEPIDMDEWHLISIASSYDAEGLGWGVNLDYAGRAIPVRVTRAWSNSGQTIKRISIQFQPETFGQPGITVPITRGGGNNAAGGWIENDPYQPETPDLDLPPSLNLMLAINDEGRLARSTNFLSKNVLWTRLTGFLGNARDITLDYFSPYFTSSGALGAWLITDDVNTLRIYYCPDAQADVLTWTLQKTLTADTTYAGKCRIISSRDEEDFAFAAWKDQTGVFFSRTTNGGASWSDAAVIGSTVTDTTRDTDDLGAAIYDEQQVIIAPDGTTGSDGQINYYLYQASTKSGSFAKVANHPTDFRAILGSLHLASVTYCYVAVEKLDPPTPPTPVAPVTFDTGGYPHYTIYQFGSVDTGGNPGNAALKTRNLASGSNKNESFYVEVDLKGNYILDTVSFDQAFATTGSLYSVAMRYKVTALDAYDTIIGAYEGVRCESASGVINGCGLSGLPGYMTLTVTAAQLGVNVPVRKIWVETLITWTNTPLSGFLDVYLDNIDITGDLVEEDTERRLYIVTPATGTWIQNITPAGGEIPQTAYGMAGSYASPDNISMIGIDADGYSYLMDSSTLGVSWQRLHTAPERGVKRSGDTVILFGGGVLELSADKGSSHYSRLGNWSSAVGSTEIKTITGVL